MDSELFTCCSMYSVAVNPENYKKVDWGNSPNNARPPPPNSRYWEDSCGPEENQEDLHYKDVEGIMNAITDGSFYDSEEITRVRNNPEGNKMLDEMLTLWGPINSEKSVPTLETDRKVSIMETSLKTVNSWPDKAKTAEQANLVKKMGKSQLTMFFGNMALQNRPLCITLKLGYLKARIPKEMWKLQLEANLVHLITGSIKDYFKTRKCIDVPSRDLVCITCNQYNKADDMNAKLFRIHYPKVHLSDYGKYQLLEYVFNNTNPFISDEDLFAEQECFGEEFPDQTGNRFPTNVGQTNWTEAVVYPKEETRYKNYVFDCNFVSDPRLYDSPLTSTLSQNLYEEKGTFSDHFGIMDHRDSLSIIKTIASRNTLSFTGQVKLKNGTIDLVTKADEDLEDQEGCVCSGVGAHLLHVMMFSSFYAVMEEHDGETLPFTRRNHVTSYQNKCPLAKLAVDDRILLPYILGKDYAKESMYVHINHKDTAKNGLSMGDIVQISNMLCKSKFSCVQDSSTVLRAIIESAGGEDMRKAGYSIWFNASLLHGHANLEKEVVQHASTSKIPIFSCTLLNMGKEDCYEEYHEMKRARLSRAITAYLCMPAEYLAAEVLNVMLDGEWIFNSGPKARTGTWFNFNNKKWYECADMDNLLFYVSNSFKTVISEYLEGLDEITKKSAITIDGVIRYPETEEEECQLEEAEECDVEDDSSVCLSQSSSSRKRDNAGSGKPKPKKRKKVKCILQRDQIGNKLTRLIRDTMTNHSKTRIVNELKQIIRQQNFKDSMNINGNIMGVKNGILVMDSTGITMRSMQMYYMCDMRAPVALLSTYKRDHPVVVFINDWITKLFPDRALRNYFWMYLASILSSGNREKIWMIWTGEHDNSKSKLVELLEHTFGDYMAQVPVSYLSEGEAHSTKADPITSSMDKLKLVATLEPNKGDLFKTGRIKRVTGGDTVFTRNLFDTGMQMKITFKLLTIANSVPKVAGIDDAMISRIRVIKFKTKWIENPPESPEEQKRQRLYKRDVELNQRFNELAPAFLWMLCKKYKSYATYGLGATPDEVRYSTQDYVDSCNTINEWLMYTNLEIHGSDSDQCINIKTVYQNYLEWARNMYSKSSIQLELSDFVQDFMKINPVLKSRLKNSVLLGVSIREQIPYCAAPITTPTIRMNGPAAGKENADQECPRSVGEDGRDNETNVTNETNGQVPDASQSKPDESVCSYAESNSNCETDNQSIDTLAYDIIKQRMKNDFDNCKRLNI